MRRARAWTDAAPRQTDAIAEALRDAEAAIGMRSAIDPRLAGAGWWRTLWKACIVGIARWGVVWGVQAIVALAEWEEVR